MFHGRGAGGSTRKGARTKNSVGLGNDGRALQGPLRSVLMTDPPCQTPSVMPTTARTLSGGGVLDRA